MTYDFDISSEVSLSRILDAFIIDDEKPELIVEFLQQHEDNIEDILQYSLYCNRLFQLDFFLKCSSSDQEYIIRLLKQIDMRDASMLVWQILRSNSGNAQTAKWKLRNDFKQILEHSVRHPYSNGHENYIAPLDMLCFKAAQDNSISCIPSMTDNSKLRNTFKYMSYSLFQKRLVQYDFFAELDALSKYVFINTAFSGCNFKDVMRFVLQLLDSDEELDIKKFCLSKFASLSESLADYINAIDEHAYSVLRQCKSFAEFMLKSMMFDANVSMFAVLYLLMYRKKWIEEWATTDEDGLNAILNVSALVKQQ